jgi:hypothetical protein
MENQKLTPINALSTTSERRDSRTTAEIVRERIVRLAELIRKDGLAYPVSPVMVNLWVKVFADVAPHKADAAFDKAEKKLKFWPAPAEVLGFVSTAENKMDQEQAEQKWQQVRDYIRIYYSPDIPPRDHDLEDGRKQNAPRITERTQRAINAAGGLAYLSNCDRESLQWAKKKFIEQYIRYGELQKDEHLLPDGKVRELLADVASTKHVDRVLLIPQPVEVAVEPAPVSKLVTEAEPKTVSAALVVDVVARKNELARQAELMRKKYPATRNMSGIPPNLQPKPGDQP